MMRVLVWASARLRRTATNALAIELAPILATVAEVAAVGQREGAFRLLDPLRFMMRRRRARFRDLRCPLEQEDLRRALREPVGRVRSDDTVRFAD